MKNLPKNIPLSLLTELLSKTDEFAVANVNADRGGPFGASVGVYNTVTKDYTDISGLQANAVLAKGIGSAHAESEALSPAIITDLRTYLSDNYSEHNYVIFSSSGESCVACASKENIVAQELVAGGLLKLGHFIVTYGATYEDTAEIAGFNDLPYLLDFQKGYGRGSIPIIDGTQYEMLEGVKRSFELSARSNIRMASVLTSDNIGFAGVDAKDISSLETAEARALRHACEDQKKRGLDTPWDLPAAFENKAQHAWRQKINAMQDPSSVLYNGKPAP